MLSLPTIKKTEGRTCCLICENSAITSAVIFFFPNFAGCTGSFCFGGLRLADVNDSPLLCLLIVTRKKTCLKRKNLVRTVTFFESHSFLYSSLKIAVRAYHDHMIVVFVS